MTQVQITDDRVQVRLSRLEKVAGLLGDLDVPVEAVTAAHAVADGVQAVRGIRAPGFALPGGRRIGTWRGGGARRYVAVRPRAAALALRLQGQRYDEVLVTTPDAEQLARQLAHRTR